MRRRKLVLEEAAPRTSYPPLPHDEELFDSPAEMQRLMVDFGLTVEQARMVRGSGLL